MMARAKSQETTLCTEMTRGSGQAGQEQVRGPVVVPLPVGSGPAQREETVDLAPDPLGAVPHHREIRDEPRVPENEADGEVG